MAEETTDHALDPLVLNKVRSLQREGGPDILGTLIALFGTNAKSMLRDLERGAEATDTELLKQAGHALHSASANIGARRLARLCRELSQSARGGSVEDAAGAVSEITAEYHRTQAALLAYSVREIEAA